MNHVIFELITSNIWTETIIMEEDQYESFVSSTAKERGTSDTTVTFKLN